MLTGQVPVLAAIKASSCIPLVYQPQIIYNQVFLDGGVNCNCIANVVPKGTLVFHIGYSQGPIIPSVIDSMPIGDFFRNVYAAAREGGDATSPTVVEFDETKLGPLSDVTDEDRKYMLQSGYDQASRFLSKFLGEKRIKGDLGDAPSKVGDTA
jgi:predicted acylesterase/phospholipase RssA